MLYRGEPTKEEGRPAEPVELPPSMRYEETRPDRYMADAGLRDAVNVALHLRQPLLLTGAPGTGKSQLAYSLAWELGFEKPFKFETKSTSESKDLFYTYDALSRFHAAHREEGSASGIEYLTLNALGLAIVLAMNDADIMEALPIKKVDVLLPKGMKAANPMRSVVLIDEVDKAPRDFPNDILNELEHMYFRIPELGNRVVSADASMQPVVVITSNSEKSLPDAFLRRCVFYHIPFPDRERLGIILRTRLGWLESDESKAPFLENSLDFFDQLQNAGLQKPPATAEILNWMVAMQRSFPQRDNPLEAPAEKLRGTLSCLAKMGPDLEATAALLQQWKAEKKAP